MKDHEIAIAVFAATLVIAGLLVVITVIILAASRRRAQQGVALAQARLSYEQELRHIEAETRETTLSHISAELHDNIGQLLTVVRLQLEKAQLRSPALADTLQPLSLSLTAVANQVRLLSHALDADMISDGGLLKALNSEVQRLQALGTYNLSFTHDGLEPPLTKDQRAVTFRIVQEVLANAFRHAAAKTIHIDLQASTAAEFCLCITDDGMGFDKARVLEKNNGLGLRNMIKRSAMANLVLQVDSSPRNGCRVLLRNRKPQEPTENC